MSEKQTDASGAGRNARTENSAYSKDRPETGSLEERGISLYHVLDSIQDGISILDSDLNILATNRTMEKWYAHQSPLIGRRCYEAYHGLDEPCEVCPTQRTLKSGKAEFDTLPRVGPRGKEGWLELFTFPMLNEGSGKVEGVIEYVRDITKRKMAEELLNESEKQHRALLDAIPDMIFRLDRNGVFLDYKPSKELEPFTDPERFIDTNIRDVMPPGVAERALLHLERAFETGESLTFDYRLMVDGSEREYEARLVVSDPEEVIAIVRDISEHRTLEEQVRHAQKMEAVGTLTGGLAHEFNNIITSIIGFGELLREGLDPDSPLKSHIDMVLSSAERAGKLTDSLLAYSRRQITHMGCYDLNSIAQEVERILKTMAGERIETNINIATQDLFIMADRSQIEQVIINLSTNAVTAMPGGGTLTISTGKATSEGDLTAHRGSIPPGEYALLSISDTGVGIPGHFQDKVFEPFFTTKDVGKGTGLGLAVVYGIIRKHNGHINLESETEKGTTFSIYLPLTRRTLPATEELPDSVAVHGIGTVLLAEDDNTVRSFLAQVLNSAGYRVIEAVNGLEAIDRFRKDTETIDIVILDIGMPKMDGYDAWLEIRKISPGVKAAFMSGHTSGDERLENVRRAALPFLQKPLKRESFLGRIQEILEQD